jgi:hypothetical protein
LTVFCFQIGCATPHVHHPRCIATAFHKLNSLCIGLGIICPNKRSYFEVVPGQTADAVGQTLIYTRHFRQNKRNEMKNQIEIRFEMPSSIKSVATRHQFWVNSVNVCCLATILPQFCPSHNTALFCPIAFICTILL